MRTKANLTQKELCRGICSTATMCKIENGEIQANVYYLEAFMQRLGRDINMYVNTCLSAKEFMNKQMRNEVNALLSRGLPDEAELLIHELEKERSYQRGINLQFIRTAKASILYNRKGFSVEYAALVLDALKATIPEFDERMIEFYHLTYYELLLINKMACDLCNREQIKRGLKVFERLIECMDRTYVDESEKVRMYSAILYNYSKHLGIAERYVEALEIVQRGQEICVKHGHTSLLPKFAINKACDLLETGKKEESIPYFAMAFYGFALNKNKQMEKIINDYVIKRLDIFFD